MKDQIDVYSEKLKIDYKKNKLKNQLRMEEENILLLQNQCSHNIVLAFDDFEEHMVGQIIQCVCPSCGKQENIYKSHEIEKTCFKKSKVLDLTKVPMSTFKSSYNTILNYLFSYYDYYFDDSISDEEKIKSIYDIVDNKTKSVSDEIKLNMKK